MLRRMNLRSGMIATAMIAVTLSAFVKADRAGRCQGRPVRTWTIKGPIASFL